MVGREDAEAVARAGGEAAWELVAALLGEVAKVGELSARLAENDRRIAELERQLSRSSSNSSSPPSQDPPKSRAERRRAAREAYKRSKRKSGGQPGHEGKAREMAAPERVDERFDHIQGACECGHRFSGSEERLGDPVVHQQWELPPISPLVFDACTASPALGAAGPTSLSCVRRGSRRRRSGRGWRPISPSSPASTGSPAARLKTSCARSLAVRSRPVRSTRRSCA